MNVKKNRKGARGKFDLEKHFAVASHLKKQEEREGEVLFP